MREHLRNNFLEGNYNITLVNWNILVAKIKEINKDFVSSGEWKWKKKKFNKKLLKFLTINFLKKCKRWNTI